ncbi:TIGR02588 family protein [Pantanalinema rosaneae CENA516]|uniref:TIGR02588 family protein n=1 Tax=Pantanalinema rosaneae TaxID=1620701 RepID=UPI003D6F9E7D
MTHLQQDSYSSHSVKRPPRSRAEWVSFYISLLIVSVIASLVVYVWATDRDRPAALNIERTEPIRITNGQFYIPFEIANSGGETVESVQVIAELQRDGEVIESGDLQVDFLSQGEKESGSFIFSNDPRQGKLVLRVSSYKLP